MWAGGRDVVSTRKGRVNAVCDTVARLWVAFEPSMMMHTTAVGAADSDIASAAVAIKPPIALQRPDLDHRCGGQTLSLCPVQALMAMDSVVLIGFLSSHHLQNNPKIMRGGGIRFKAQGGGDVGSFR